MSRRFQFVAVLTLLIAVLGLGACHQTLRAPVKIDPDIEEVRDKYRTLYPDDPYLVDIARSELRKGMSPTQVYVAWGLPMQSSKSDKGRNWLYEFSSPPETQPKTVAHLFFEKDKLVRWRVVRGYVYFLDPQSKSAAATEIKDLPSLSTSKQLED